MVSPTAGSVIQPMGSSPERIDSDVLSMNAALHVVLDDPKPIPLYQSAGSKVIFRLAADDHAHEKWDPVAFVAMLDAVAPPGAWLHMGNEPGRANLPRLNDWSLVAAKECHRLGRTGIFYNFSTGEPEEWEWAQLAPSLAYIVATGQWVGVHEYYLLTIERGIADHHVGRCRVLRRLYPTLNIALTEVGMVTGLSWINGVWMYNPNAGWQAGSSAAEAGNQVARGVETVWSRIGAPVTNFLEGHWDRTSSFNTAGQAAFFAPVRAANDRIRQGGSNVVEGKKTLQITSTSDIVNIRALPSLSGKVLLQAPTGTVVFAVQQQVQAGGHLWQALDFGNQTAWVSLGVVKLA